MRFLTERGFANIAQLARLVRDAGQPLDATSGPAAVPRGAVDGWELARTLGRAGAIPARLGARPGHRARHAVLGRGPTTRLRARGSDRRERSPC